MTIQLKATEQYSFVVLFIVLQKVMILIKRDNFFPQLTNFMNDCMKILAASSNGDLLLSANSSNHRIASKVKQENEKDVR